MSGDPPTVADVLALHARDVEALVRREAGSLLVWETVEDLVQGAHARVLERASGFTWQGPEAALAWVRIAARSHLAHRREHWRALRRKPAALLRVTLSDDETRAAARLPADTSTGPATFAARREAIELAVRALDLLLERDRELVLGAIDGRSVSELGAKLGLSAESAGRAQRRALERLRRTFRVLSAP
ncbi:MAG TPA: sigma-70 family RNA polymerase sigma factor [Planctomycetota bacterium]|nr:sigma-70 family RNA polymerase sigma factor [Planctomycetota bacterium]